MFFPPKEVLYERLFCKEQGVEIRFYDEKPEIHSGLIRNEKRAELSKPTSTDMDFLTLVNLRLDEVEQRLSH
ncbi:MAG: hypothetical protein GY799_20545 [Desulfobulbaceae bacterium]|nr:hypothetical protein [Desulfobulbaceae bacterium]